MLLQVHKDLYPSLGQRESGKQKQNQNQKEKEKTENRKQKQSKQREGEERVPKIQAAVRTYIT